jgi:hypothetical protein
LVLHSFSAVSHKITGKLETQSRTKNCSALPLSVLPHQRRQQPPFIFSTSPAFQLHLHPCRLHLPFSNPHAFLAVHERQRQRSTPRRARFRSVVPRSSERRREGQRGNQLRFTPFPSYITFDICNSLQGDIEERLIDGDGILDDDGCSAGHIEMHLVRSLDGEEEAESSRRNKAAGKRKKTKKKGSAISTVHRSERMRQQVCVF